MIIVTGVLVNPNNIPVPNRVIRITSIKTETTLIGSVVEVSTDNVGFYSFTLVDGEYSIDAFRTDEYELAGDVVVSGTTPASITLPALLNL